MGRKNRRISDDLFLPPIKEERRSMPRCRLFPEKTVFTTGYRAQVAVDEIRYRSNRKKTPIRVYECNPDDGGCGYFHITSQENHNDADSDFDMVASDSERRTKYYYDARPWS